MYSVRGNKNMDAYYVEYGMSISVWQSMSTRSVLQGGPQSQKPVLS